LLPLRRTRGRPPRRCRGLFSGERVRAHDECRRADGRACGRRGANHARRSGERFRPVVHARWNPPDDWRPCGYRSVRHLLQHPKTPAVAHHVANYSPRNADCSRHDLPSAEPRKNRCCACIHSGGRGDHRLSLAGHRPGADWPTGRPHPTQNFLSISSGLPQPWQKRGRDTAAPA
jgi:hypothetical protein